jgi:hypothetical protein
MHSPFITGIDSALQIFRLVKTLGRKLWGFLFQNSYNSENYGLISITAPGLTTLYNSSTSSLVTAMHPLVQSVKRCSLLR